MRQHIKHSIFYALLTCCFTFSVFPPLSPLHAQSGVGVPDPPGVSLPSVWIAGCCPQLQPPSDWPGNPNCNAVGFNWRTQCPSNGWRGWFAEWFQCTEAAICLGWNADLWGTRATHNGNFRRDGGQIKCNYSLRDFHIAEVYWDKGHPAYQLMYATGEYPCKPTTGVIEREPITPGTRVQRLENGVWVEDVVKSAGRQIVEFESGVRMTVGDEDRKWRRVADGTSPSPVPPPVLPPDSPDPRPDPPDPDPQPPPVINPPPPTPPPASQICPEGQACREPCPICEDCVDCPPQRPLVPWPAECLPEIGMDEHFRVIKERMLGVRQSRRDAAYNCYVALKRAYKTQ